MRLVSKIEYEWIKKPIENIKSINLFKIAKINQLKQENEGRKPDL